MHFGPGAAPGPWLSYEVLHLREWLIASAAYLERRGTPTSIDELAGHELLAWAAPGEDGRMWPTLAGDAFEVEPALITADVHLIRQCALAGLGLALVPDAGMPDPGVADGVLVPVLPGIVGRERTLHVAAPAALAALPKLRAVVRDIQSFAEGISRARGG